MSEVFIIEPPRHNIDVSKAAKYGEIIYVFNYSDRRCSVWSHVSFGMTVLQRLKELGFDSKNDFICVVGSMVTVVIAFIAIAQHYDEFNVLLFNSIDDAYVQKRFNRYDWKGSYDEARDATVTEPN